MADEPTTGDSDSSQAPPEPSRPETASTPDPYPAIGLSSVIGSGPPSEIAGAGTLQPPSEISDPQTHEVHRPRPSEDRAEN